MNGPMEAYSEPAWMVAERVVVGLALQGPDAADEALALVRREHLYVPAHRTIWGAISDLRAAGDHVDPRTVAAALGADLARAGGDALGGFEYMVVLEAEAGVRSGLRTHARRVVEECRRRGVMGDLGAAIEALRGGAEVDALIARVVERHANRADLGGPDVLRAVNWPEFWEADHTGEQWIVEPLIPAGRSVALFAKAKEGKSVIALFVAAAVATGRPVLGQPAGSPRDVLYLDFEMTPADLRERLEDFGYGPDDDLSRLHYALIPSLPPLDTAEGGRILRDQAARLGAKVVVLDTMSRVVEGDENTSDTYRAFHRHTGAGLKADGVAVLRLDHSGKDTARGQRGSSAKNDDVDVVWEMQRAAGGYKLTALYKRVTWVPERLDIAYGGTPLALTVGPKLWTADALEVVRQLDRLGVPIDASATTALAALKAAGESRRKGVVLEALRCRKADPKRLSEGSGTGAGTGVGNQLGNRPEPVSSDGANGQVRGKKSGREPVREPVGTAVGTGSPPIGGTVPGYSGTTASETRASS